MAIAFNEDVPSPPARKSIVKRQALSVASKDTGKAHKAPPKPALARLGAEGPCRSPLRSPHTAPQSNEFPCFLENIKWRVSHGI